MKIIKLDESFYNENNNLQEALDLIQNNWIENKTRGFGLVIININELTFAIPLRSNIKHKASFVTKKSHVGNSLGKGLDYSKALLITKSSYILTEEPFLIPTDEYISINNKENYIIKSFEKYVSKYISAVKNNDTNILNSKIYRFTTLKNYHKELGCN